MSDAASSRDSAFWRFSLSFYALPEVASSCIELQDKAGVDVNLMLFLLFLANDNHTVTKDDVARLDAAIAPWRNDVVIPLRDLRRRLKGGIGSIPASESEGFRNMVKRVELEAERLEQSRLEREAAKFAATETSREAAAKINLAAYAAHLGQFPATPAKIILDAFTTSAR